MFYSVSTSLVVFCCIWTHILKFKYFPMYYTWCLFIEATHVFKLLLLWLLDNTKKREKNSYNLESMSRSVCLHVKGCHVDLQSPRFQPVLQLRNKGLHAWLICLRCSLATIDQNISYWHKKKMRERYGNVYRPGLPSVDKIYSHWESWRDRKFITFSDCEILSVWDKSNLYLFIWFKLNICKHSPCTTTIHDMWSYCWDV